MYEVPIGKAAIRRPGSDVTIVATSQMCVAANTAAKELEHQGISAELIDLRSLKPWDSECIIESVAKTGRLVIVDEAWKTCGFAAEIAAEVASEAFDSLIAPIRRVCLPDVPAPCSSRLEEAYYLRPDHIVGAAAEIYHGSSAAVSIHPLRRSA
jgi:pyruvate dehydrogenase E1 component beta subunit